MKRTYFKRFRMELDLRRPRPRPDLPFGFTWLLLFLYSSSVKLATLTVFSALIAVLWMLGTLRLPGWQSTGISQAVAKKDCDSDGCTYRTELRTTQGDSRPISPRTRAVPRSHARRARSWE